MNTAHRLTGVVRFTGLVWFFTLAGLLIAAAARAAPPADLDAYAEHVLATFESPGMVVAIAERGQPTVVRSYGVRRQGQPAKVDDETLFAIGSTTKAFTSAVLATMVDEGKLTWDTKVSDVLPGFKMHDAYVSSEMTVRDLLVHRSGLGLGAGDLLFFPPTDLSRDDIVHRLRYLKPATSFRSSFAYSNLMYVVAGQVIEAVGGSSWEQAIRQRVLQPLQMDRTTTTSVMPADANRAWPHARVSTDLRGSGPVTALPEPLNLDNAAPAGALNTSGAEIARWLELQIGRGLDPRSGKRIYSEAQAREMWSPQTIVPVRPNPKPLELAQASYQAYAFGWGVSDYRGQQVVAHAGGVLGTVAYVVIVPQKDVAFAILLNSEEGGALAAMRYRLLDHYLGLQSPDWPAAMAEIVRARIAEGRKALDASIAAQKSATDPAKAPSLPLEKFAGRYRDAWYGGATIEHTAKGLTLRMQHTPALSGPLEHVRYDTFRARWADRTLEDAYVTFALTADGTIAQMTMRAVSPLADFSYDYQDLLFRPEP